MATTVWSVMKFVCDNGINRSSYSENNSNTDNDVVGNDTSSDIVSGLMKLKNPWEAATASLLLLLCIFIIVGNTLTMIAIQSTRSLKTEQNKYIFSLGGADQLVGCFLAQILIDNYFSDDIHWVSCRITTAQLNSSIACSLFNMLSIAVDRYIFIVHPFTHMRHVTSKRTNVIIVIQWVVAFIIGFGTVYGLTDDDNGVCGPLYALQDKAIVYVQSAHFISVSIGIGITYGMIAKVAKYHQDRRMKRVQKNSQEINAKGSPKTKGGQFDQLSILKTEDDDNILNAPDAKCRRNNSNVEQELKSIPTHHTNVKFESDTSARHKYKPKKLENLNITSSVSEITTIHEEGHHGSEGVSFISSPHLEAPMVETKTDCPLKEYKSSSCLNQKYVRVESAIKDNVQHSNQKNHEIQQVARKPERQDLKRSDLTNTLSLSSLRWLKQMVIVFGLFLLCWTPSMVSMLISVSFVSVNRKAIYVLCILGYSNSAVNFFVYSLYNKQFRQAIKRILRGQCRE